jgi:hypothetical protein
MISSCTFVAVDDIKPNKARDQVIAKMREKNSYESNLVGDLLKPFDHQALVQMAANPETDTGGQLVRLILRAGAVKDAKFQYLLGQKKLRKDPEVDLALLAYDYSVNGNQKALKSILSRHVNEVRPASWESSTVMVLAYVNEWNLVKKALESHVLSGDGAGGDSHYAFWLTRMYLFPSNRQFPDDYKKFTAQIWEQQRIAEQAPGSVPNNRH